MGVDDTGYDVKFFGATSGDYMQWDESANKLYILSDNNTPVDLTTSAATCMIMLKNGGTSANNYVGSNAGEIYLSGDENGSSGYVKLKTNNVEGLRIDSSQDVRILNGNVGVRASPESWYSTFGSVGVGASNSAIYGRSENNVIGLASNAHLDNTNVRWQYIGTGVPARFESINGTHNWYSAASGTDGNEITWTTTMTLSASGALVATDNVTAYSDASIKANIEPIDNAIEKVGMLHGSTYTRTDLADHSRQYAGLIAQDVEKVLPSAVSEHNGVKTLDYNATIALLVQAVKEQQGEIEELRSRINGIGD